MPCGSKSPALPAPTKILPSDCTAVAQPSGNDGPTEKFVSTTPDSSVRITPPSRWPFAPSSEPPFTNVQSNPPLPSDMTRPGNSVCLNCGRKYCGSDMPKEAAREKVAGQTPRHSKTKDNPRRIVRQRQVFIGPFTWS